MLPNNIGHLDVHPPLALGTLACLVPLLPTAVIIFITVLPNLDLLVITFSLPFLLGLAPVAPSTQSSNPLVPVVFLCVLSLPSRFLPITMSVVPAALVSGLVSVHALTPGVPPVAPFLSRTSFAELKPTLMSSLVSLSVMTERGLVFHSKYSDVFGWWGYSISTGLGTSQHIFDPDFGSGFHHANCSAASHDHSAVDDYCWSPCCSDYSGSSSCPLEWGTYSLYVSFRPGCNDGSYYPVSLRMKRSQTEPVWFSANRPRTVDWCIIVFVLCLSPLLFGIIPLALAWVSRLNSATATPSLFVMLIVPAVFITIPQSPTRLT